MKLIEKYEGYEILLDSNGFFTIGLKNGRKTKLTGLSSKAKALLKFKILSEGM